MRRHRVRGRKLCAECTDALRGDECDAGACAGDDCPGDACDGGECDAGACDGSECDAGTCVGNGCDAGTCEGSECDAGTCDGSECDAGACDGSECDAASCEGGLCQTETCDGGACADASCEGEDCGAPDNHAPDVTSASTAESLSGATHIGYVATATDADGDALSWSIAGGADATRFVVDGDTGELRFVHGPVFELATDSDGDNVFEVTLRVSDGELEATQGVSVTVLRPDTSGMSVYDRNLALYRAARNVVYRCEITGDDTEGAGPYDLGNIYFAYGEGLQGFDDGEVWFYPVGESPDACTDPAQVGQEAEEQQPCLFFASRFPRWGLHVADAGEALPLQITSVLHAVDCEQEDLAEGITPGICAAEYTCYAEQAMPNEELRERQQANFEAYQAALRSTYDCHVAGDGYDLGHVYYRYGYGAAGTVLDNLYFRPVADDCTVRPTGPTPIDATQPCVFSESWMRWSLYLGDATEFGADLPETLTQLISNHFDCGYDPLQEGVTVEMCRAEYECTRIPDAEP